MKSEQFFFEKKREIGLDSQRKKNISKLTKTAFGSMSFS